MSTSHTKHFKLVRCIKCRRTNRTEPIVVIGGLFWHRVCHTRATIQQIRSFYHNEKARVGWNNYTLGRRM